jgi:hypothetical protein
LPWVVLDVPLDRSFREACEVLPARFYSGVYEFRREARIRSRSSPVRTVLFAHTTQVA